MINCNSTAYILPFLFIDTRFILSLLKIFDTYHEEQNFTTGEAATKASTSNIRRYSKAVYYHYENEQYAVWPL